ncbi:hypothetical protein IHE44_0013086 [Lamprotornis superbus]|uniref:Inhibitor of growth protein N-terminal histone-binding domain-containing protein n=1 Tax=Lamprotornis superbus TaxID=245042 RepID=A0A835P2S5_9PASS|nr:hypothetical protein IHE44_0013086 [Lamprotornis superbus]
MGTGNMQVMQLKVQGNKACGLKEALKEIDDVYEKYKSENDPVQKKRLQQHLQRALINSQELGDEKIQIVTQMLELVENRARQMETHSQCFQDMSENEKPLEKAKMESCQPERSSRRPRRQRTSESRDLCHIANGIDDCDDQPPKEKRSKSSKKKKRSKAKQERESSNLQSNDSMHQHGKLIYSMITFYVAIEEPPSMATTRQQSNIKVQLGLTLYWKDTGLSSLKHTSPS